MPQKKHARPSGRSVTTGRLRVFIDTSALLAGLNSPTGAAGIVLAACFARFIIPVISKQVIEETERNLALKFALLQPQWTSFLLIPPEVARDPSLAKVKQAFKAIQTDDAPILASALLAKPNAFVTWNTRHFLRPRVQELASFPILIPEEFLTRFLRNR